MLGVRDAPAPSAMWHVADMMPGLSSGHFLEKGAKEVVGHLGKMMMLDVATKALLIDDLKSGLVKMESPLLVNELMGFGGNTSVWTCFVCVLRERTLALYVPIVTEGTGKLATAGMRVRALYKGGHKVVDYIEPNGAADLNGFVREKEKVRQIERRGGGRRVRPWRWSICILMCGMYLSVAGNNRVSVCGVEVTGFAMVRSLCKCPPGAYSIVSTNCVIADGAMLALLMGRGAGRWR